MAEINLTQAEADALIAMEKHRADDEKWPYPDMGGSVCIPLVSADGREKFLLDIERGGIDAAKIKYQDRARQVVVLYRLDLAGSPHRNPDEQEIPTPHLHYYVEGYGDKWARAVTESDFPDIADAWETLQAFMRFCNITQPPSIVRQRSLFE